MVDRGHHRGQPGILVPDAITTQVVAADLDCDRALARRRRDDIGLEAFTDSTGQAKPVEAGAGQDQGVGLTVVEPAQPGIHVAVEGMDSQVGPMSEQESRPARAVGADSGTRRQVVEPPREGVRPDNQGIARISPLEIGADLEMVVDIRRQVLGTVDGNVHPAMEQRHLDRRDEGALAPGRIRPATVTVGLDDHDSTGQAGPGERRLDEPGLDQGELAAAGADRDRGFDHSAKMSRTACSLRPSLSRPSRSNGSRRRRRAR